MKEKDETMRSRMTALLGVCAVSMAITGASIAPAQAVAGCSVGVNDSGTVFWSYCSAASGVSSHNAKAQIYFNSGYSGPRFSKKQAPGVYSYSPDYSGVGYVMEGPWIQVAY